MCPSQCTKIANRFFVKLDLQHVSLPLSAADHHVETLGNT